MHSHRVLTATAAICFRDDYMVRSGETALEYEKLRERIECCDELGTDLGVERSCDARRIRRRRHEPGDQVKDNPATVLY